jgi:hypothetical protein
LKKNHLFSLLGGLTGPRKQLASKCPSDLTLILKHQNSDIDHTSIAFVRDLSSREFQAELMQTHAVPCSHCGEVTLRSISTLFISAASLSTHNGFPSQSLLTSLYFICSNISGFSARILSQGTKGKHTHVLCRSGATDNFTHTQSLYPHIPSHTDSLTPLQTH